MKVLFCLTLLVVAQSMDASVIPRRLKDWSKVQELWAVTDESIVPKVHSQETPVLQREPKDFRAVCGQPNLSSSRIVNGVVATPNEYPWVAALFINGLSFCTGTLISDEWVLTAGHCLVNMARINIMLGAHDVNAASEPNRIEIASNNSFKVVHPNYNANTLDGDIALVRLPERISFTENIRPICLQDPTDKDDKVGEIAKLTGWGKTSDAESAISSKLQKTDAKVIDNKDCATVYGSIITNGILCTSTINQPFAGTCNGDSGGPLSIVDKDGIYRQYGVTSFVSSQGCESGNPDGFTRIREYLDWIQIETGITL